MPDISKCLGTDPLRRTQYCPLKDSCWRYTSEPTPLGQAYFKDPPFKTDKDGKVTCDSFWKDTRGTTICKHGTPTDMRCPLCGTGKEGGG